MRAVSRSAPGICWNHEFICLGDASTLWMEKSAQGSCAIVEFTWGWQQAMHVIALGATNRNTIGSDTFNCQLCCQIQQSALMIQRSRSASIPHLNICVLPKIRITSRCLSNLHPGVNTMTVSGRFEIAALPIKRVIQMFLRDNTAWALDSF